MDRAEKTAIASLLGNMGLTAFKATLALLTGSTVIFADAVHSATDVIVSLFVLFNIKIMKLNAGWTKWLSAFLTLSVAILIFVAGYSVFQQASKPQPEGLNYPLLLFGVYLCIGVAYYLSKFILKAGNELNSTPLIADGYHIRTDMFTSIAVFISLLGDYIGVGLAKYAGWIIALFIFNTGFDMIIKSVAILSKNQKYQSVGITTSLFGKGEFVSKNTFINKILTAISKIKLFFQKPIWLVIIVIISSFAYITSGGFSVPIDSTAIVLNFGAIDNNIKPPGLHYALPPPMSEKLFFKPDRIRRVEVGFRTRKLQGKQRDGEWFLWSSKHLSGTYSKQLKEAERLSGDENIVDIDCVVTYNILDEKKVFLELENVDELIRATLEINLSLMASSMSFDDIIIDKRIEFERQLKTSLVKKLKSLAGDALKIVSVRVLDVHPPVKVVGAFREVFSAREKQAELILKATAMKNETIPAARAKMVEIVNKSKSEGYEITTKAIAETQKVATLQKSFMLQPQLNKFRMKREMLETVLADKEKYILPASLTKNSSRGGIDFILPANDTFGNFKDLQKITPKKNTQRENYRHTSSEGKTK